MLNVFCAGFTELPHGTCTQKTIQIRFAKSIRTMHLLVMSTVQEIKNAISKLSLEERAEILSELCGWQDDSWDSEMKRDAATGKFSALNRNADAVQAAGKTCPLDAILGET
jgi:hypothetical protein